MITDNVDKLPLACSAVASGFALLKSVFSHKNEKCSLPRDCTAHTTIQQRLENGDKRMDSLSRDAILTRKLVVAVAAKEGLISPDIKQEFQDLM